MLKYCQLAKHIFNYKIPVCPASTSAKPDPKFGDVSANVRKVIVAIEDRKMMVPVLERYNN